MQGAMIKDRAPRPTVPPRFFAQVLLPFAIPALVTFVLLALVGEDWPRNIPPGSGLKLAGFVAAAATSLLVWRYATRGLEDGRVRKAAALLCAVTGLMGWPIWSVGVLPSVNGYSLGAPKTVRMTLERTEVTTVSRSSRLNHWAWLRPEVPGSRLQAGRYFIPGDVYEDWTGRQPRTVGVTIVPGMLGAEVVTGYGADLPVR